MPRIVGVLQFASIATLVVASIAFIAAAFSETLNLSLGWGLSVLVQGMVAAALLYGIATIIEYLHRIDGRGEEQP